MTGCTSGNATLLVALGMPMLIGGAGLGVDVTQWYMWKRELQFAVDQAAIAGAWARADEDTESTYITRAEQEFDANMQVAGGFASDPEIQLADYAGGEDNSVAVSVTAHKPLPFTSILTEETFPVYAYAQASFEEGTTFSSCLIALDDDDYGAITIGGNSVLTASCGLAALSTDDTAITVSGNPQVDAGWILAAGGVDQWLKDNTDDVIMEHMEGLFDPFEELSPPNPSSSRQARTYSCSAEPDTTTANKSVTTTVTYSYWKGNTNNRTEWNGYASPKASTEYTAPTEVGISVPNGTVAGTTNATTTTWTGLGGNGQDRKWEKAVTVTTTTYSNVLVTPGAQAGSVRPGTYTDIQIRCNTAFAPGVYNIVGGGLKITGQYEVTGSAVMFVLYDGAWIDVAGGADVNLTAMQASDLMSLGVSADDANELAGMLVFEDRDSRGSSKTKLNGNANTVLNGTLYFPVSNVQFAGTVGVTSQCLMIAANNITITGTTNMTTFCPAGSTEDTTVATTEARVRLVA
ncbi:pilus assembly protein TadG-related protein [Aurantiacibacter luteus]|nr:pilus assembly protein TadG-related protein [Aurantiacibacter luteus]